MPIRSCIASLLMVIALPAAGAGTVIEDLRLSSDPQRTRIVLDLSGPAEYTLFALSDPERVVIDLPAVLGNQRALDGAGQSPVLSGVRTGKKADGQLRVVLDLTTPVKASSFLQAPGNGRGHRLVVDLERLESGQEAPPVKTAAAVEKLGRDVVVVIDAGHGGKDPGARGPRGTREKDVVLAIAGKLADRIDETPGMKAVMIRDEDIYPSLHDRRNRARAHQADLFVSIHADAFKDRRARGSSVYVLSERGASSEAARWLAEKENQALLGGVHLDQQDDVVASVLLDLSQDWTLSSSQVAAEMVLNELGKVNRLHSDTVKRAGFLVLKSPDVPSIFVEAAFISNPDEERKLNDPGHQKRMASAIHAGIFRYFSAHAPEDTLIAARQNDRPPATRTYVISNGDTLSEIAETHRVSLDTLRSMNRLSGDRIRIGQKIQIPVSAGG